MNKTLVLGILMASTIIMAVGGTKALNPINERDSRVGTWLVTLGSVLFVVGLGLMPLC